MVSDAAEVAREPRPPTTISAVTEAHVERFTWGHCHLLAAAIHRQTGWPLHAVAVPEEDRRLTPYSWVHAFVRMPDGRFLDVTGPHDVAYLLDTYGDVLEADLGEIDQLHRVDDIGVYEVTTEHLRVEGIELDVECEAVAAYLLANLVSM